MNSGFDDHATVVALEFLVKRLVMRQCLAATDSDSMLAEWISALKAEANLAMLFAYDERTQSEQAKVNAIATAGELDRFAEDLTKDFADAQRS